MLSVSLDRFAGVAIADPQDRPIKRGYNGPYSDPWDDGDWLEHMDEEKKRRFGLLEEGDDE